MSQKNVEILIGRLVTDETLRGTFLSNPEAITAFVGRGWLDLNQVEIEALHRDAARRLAAWRLASIAATEDCPGKRMSMSRDAHAATGRGPDAPARAGPPFALLTQLP
jgi:hypothetical protein